MKKYNFIDAIVIGEGERTFKELVEHWLSNETDLGKIDGITYRKKGKVLLTKKRQQISNLDEIPSPYLEKIVDEKVMKSHNNYIPTETMRGCAYRCHYCYYHKEFGKLSYFSMDRVEKELKYLLGKEPLRIYLMDPTFNINKKRAKEILRIFIRYNKKTRLRLELRAELLDQEMVNLLDKANIGFIEIGIQSTNKKTLRLINRAFEQNQFKKNILLLNKKRIHYEIQLIDGLPADNYQSLKKSIDWLSRLKPCRIKIMRFNLLPGTYLRYNARYFGIKYNRRPPYHSIESNTFSSHDLKKTQDLRNALRVLYNVGLLKSSLYSLAKKLRIDFSEILEEWNNWMLKEHRDITSLLEDIEIEENNKIEQAVEIGCISKLSDLAVNFTEYLGQKYNKSHLPRQVLSSVHQDVEVFLKRHGVTKERV